MSSSNTSSPPRPLVFALAPRSRALLAAAALASFAAAFATTPIVARGAGNIAPLDPSHVATLPAPTPLLVVVPRRDPFAGGADGPPASAPTPDVADARARLAMPNVMLPVPPSLGTPVFQPVATSRVTAIVTGGHPTALVDENGSARIIAVGDLFAGARVVHIDLNGVRLTNGATLAVAAADATPPPSLPVPPPRSGGHP